MRNKTFALATILIVASMVMAACQPAPVAEPEVIVETVMVEGESQIIEVTATPEPAPEAKKVLNFAWDLATFPPLILHWAPIPPQSRSSSKPLWV